MKRFAGVWLLAAMWAVPALAQPPGKEPVVLNLDFKAQLQADGSLANVEPDAALAPALQALLRKQVAGWRYVPGTWQGRPVLPQVAQRIVAEALPVASGGYALRIKEVTGMPVVFDAKRMAEDFRMFPPRYPQEAQRQGIEATLVYAMRRDPQGAPIEVELVDAQVSKPWLKRFDAAGREAIRQWRLQPTEVEGQVIDCRLLTPMTFRVGSGKPTPMPGMQPYRPRYPDACPGPPALETKVEGRML